VNTPNLQEQKTRPTLALRSPEIEFLDIKLTKDLSLLLCAFHSPFYWQILQKTVLFSGFKKPYRKIRETRNLKSIHE
jgi:hypothetical protein